MKTTHLFALVAVLTVAGLSSVRAGEWGGDCRGGGWGGERGGEWNYFDHVGAFCKEHGVKFSHGYFYPGLVQKHFTEKWYDEHFQTYMNWDPHAHCPYYFCEGHGVWYPIHYIEKVGPGAKGPGPVVGTPGPGPGPSGPVLNGAPVPGDGQSGPVGPNTPTVGVVPNAPNGGSTGAGVAPPAGQQAAPPVVPNPPPAGGNTGAGGPPPEPTSSDAGRVARAQTPAARDIPTGTFEDAIPETK